MFTIAIEKANNARFNTCTISNTTGTKAVIYPTLGASLQQLYFNKKTIINNIITKDGQTQLLNSSCSAILCPFANRIKDGQYNYNEQTYQLECNETARGHAMHGLVYRQAFEFSSSQVFEDRAEVAFTYTEAGKKAGFPFPFTIKVTYILLEQELRLEVDLQNTGNSSFPFSLGWHPYFYSNNLEKSTLYMKSDTKIEADEGMIPTGIQKEAFPFPLVLQGCEFDDGYALSDSTIRLETLDYTINIRTEKDNSPQFIQLYIPSHRQSIAIEPMTAPADCYNNNIGLKELAPNTNYQIAWIVEEI